MRTISEIRKEIEASDARSAWQRGVRTYAVELFDEMTEHRHLKDTDLLTDKVTEKELLNGADDWSQYSYGGCAEIYDGDICERLCSTSVVQKKREGELPPNRTETWLDVQARALKQAASRVRRYANRDLRAVQ